MNPDREIHPLCLRLPRNLHADLAQAAKDNGRSMNREIIERLEKAMLEQEVLAEVMPVLRAAVQRVLWRGQ